MEVNRCKKQKCHAKKDYGGNDLFVNFQSQLSLPSIKAGVQKEKEARILRRSADALLLKETVIISEIGRLQLDLDKLQFERDEILQKISGLECAEKSLAELEGSVAIDSLPSYTYLHAFLDLKVDSVIHDCVFNFRHGISHVMAHIISDAVIDAQETNEYRMHMINFLLEEKDISIPAQQQGLKLYDKELFIQDLTKTLNQHKCKIEEMAILRTTSKEGSALLWKIAAGSVKPETIYSELQCFVKNANAAFCRVFISNGTEPLGMFLNDKTSAYNFRFYFYAEAIFLGFI